MSRPAALPAPPSRRDLPGLLAVVLLDRSGFTQSTDEFFFTASNQTVKDLRDRHPVSQKHRKPPQASKLAPGPGRRAIPRS